MGKKLDEPRVSPFDALRIARLAKVAPDVQTVEQPDIQTVKQPDVLVTGLAKSRDPRYVKFTTYIPREMHLRAKSRLVSQGRELSDLVAELLDGWLAKQADV
ncbi:MAG: hypothetical protein IPP47_20490 [Bryobacterales bacterium]|nr:hypothetical protein [Bryobacterales bacterium]